MKTEILAFLRKCKSLNEAVKLFPAVKLYLSDRDIERLETKVQRGPRAELVSDVDTGALTAAALAARLAQPAGSEA